MFSKLLAKMHLQSFQVSFFRQRLRFCVTFLKNFSAVLHWNVWQLWSCAYKSVIFGKHCVWEVESLRKERYIGYFFFPWIDQSFVWKASAFHLPFLLKSAKSALFLQNVILAYQYVTYLSYILLEVNGLLCQIFFVRAYVIRSVYCIAKKTLSNFVYCWRCFYEN